MRHISVHQREVFACDRMILQLGRKRSMSLIILSRHQQPGRILIDTMNNSGAQFAINAGKILAVIH
ncbi:hypothetical protein D3C72_1754540 [compost metagenome]